MAHCTADAQADRSHTWARAHIPLLLTLHRGRADRLAPLARPPPRSGTRKKTPFAGQLAAEKALTAAVAKGVRSLVVKVKGIGRGRETALRSLVTSEEVEVTAIEDVTPIPHNGCRPKKSRRL